MCCGEHLEARCAEHLVAQAAAAQTTENSMAASKFTADLPDIAGARRLAASIGEPYDQGPFAAPPLFRAAHSEGLLAR